MSTACYIAHVTDLHIGATDLELRNVNVRRNFSRIMDAIQPGQPDMLVLGGDLAAVNGEKEAYEWIRRELDARSLPYQVMAGNHDQSPVMARIFDLDAHLHHQELCYRTTIKGHHLFLLDSSSGRISAEQLEWLESQTAEMDGRALLFVHHPPTLTGCAFMDRRYPLQNIGEAFSRIQELDPIRHIFCGHYHTEKTVVVGDHNLFMTPSTMLQIDQNNPEYEVSSRQPGWRSIRWDGIRLETAAHYLEADDS